MHWKPLALDCFGNTQILGSSYSLLHWFIGSISFWRRSLLASLMLAPCLAHVLFFTLTFDEDNSRHIIPIFDSYVTKITDCGQSCIFCNNKIMCACVFVYFAQHVALSATLRRIGEEASKPAAQSTVLQSADPDLPKSCSETAGPIRNLPLYQSPCPDTRILSILIILRTVTQGIISDHRCTYSIFGIIFGKCKQVLNRGE